MQDLSACDTSLRLRDACKSTLVLVRRLSRGCAARRCRWTGSYAQANKTALARIGTVIWAEWPAACCQGGRDFVDCDCERWCWGVGRRATSRGSGASAAVVALEIRISLVLLALVLISSDPSAHLARHPHGTAVSFFSSSGSTETLQDPASRQLQGTC